MGEIDIGRLEWKRPTTATATYEEILADLQRNRELGSLRQRIDIDTWAPLVHIHCPDPRGTSDRCAGCGQLWPCGPIIQVLRSGVLTADTYAGSSLRGYAGRS
ncbi:hypothetical protein SCMU_28740 [Sinomonas cyclohexanicum]|uniref:Uncharacterized protein n=1 Tax=Sinomonas cyclohexanicum TaxID=322009 RepID=A0ABN6FJH4_SINCY|nr:hypothetical protein SCMU_28740 [Corynebacterium cyclohexanicum]